MHTLNSELFNSSRFQSVARSRERRQSSFPAAEMVMPKVASAYELRRHVGSLLRLIAGVPAASDPDQCPGDAARAIWDATSRLASLSTRQRQVLTCIVGGAASKNIAADLGLSQRTIEHHRAEVMRKMGSNSIPMLARITVAASWSGTEETIGQCHSREFAGNSSTACPRCPFGY